MKKISKILMGLTMGVLLFFSVGCEKNNVDPCPNGNCDSVIVDTNNIVLTDQEKLLYGKLWVVDSVIYDGVVETNSDGNCYYFEDNQDVRTKVLDFKYILVDNELVGLYTRNPNSDTVTFNSKEERVVSEFIFTSTQYGGKIVQLSVTNLKVDVYTGVSIFFSTK